MSDRRSSQADGRNNRLPEEQPFVAQNFVLSYNNFYKTSLCRPFLAGKCIFSDRCNYAHSTEELRPLVDLTKTKMCPRLQRPGGCMQPKCRYAHHPSELKATDTFYKTSLCIDFDRTGKCKLGDLCRHAHGEAELKPKPETLYKVYKPEHFITAALEKKAHGNAVAQKPERLHDATCVPEEPQQDELSELVLIEYLLKQPNILELWDSLTALQLQQEEAGSTSANSGYERVENKPPPGLNRRPPFQRRRKRFTARASVKQ